MIDMDLLVPIINLTILGIKVYEMFQDEFRELTEEIRSSDIEEDKKSQIQSVSQLKPQFIVCFSKS